MTRKPSSLAQIRRQVAVKSRSTAAVTNQSAFHRMEKKNERFVHGSAIRDRDPEDFQRFLPQKVTKRTPKRKIKPRSKAPTKPSEAEAPEVECRGAAGGDRHLHEDDDAPGTPTRTSGVARVPAWTLEAFKASLKEVIEQYGEVQDFVTQEIKDGVEDCVDVYAVFRSELVAELVKDGLDGKMVDGRKVRVRFC